MIEGSCHCGDVKIVLEASPTELTECNCSICRRYGVLWAYYSKHQVRIDAIGAPQHTYICNGQTQLFFRCARCGCVSHWAPLDQNRSDMGVNARLLDPSVLAQAKLHHLDGAVTDQYLD